jgi:preprotein translocase subunit SecD
MHPKLKRTFSLIGIFLLAAAAVWIVHPGGSTVNLKALKIPFEKDFKVNLGLDLQGGSHLVYQADFKDLPSDQHAESLSGIRDIIERRVNSFGVSEPLVAVSGDDKVIIELPGIKDVNEAIRQIGETPQLEFRVQNEEAPELTVDENGAVTLDALLAQWKPSGLSGKQLQRATPEIQGSAGFNQPVVRLEFNEEGKELFAKITSENVGKPVAIVLDGQILSAPTVNEAITDGIAVISGSFSAEDVKILARRLNSGALPVPIKLVSQQNVGATLGKESVQKSVIAGLIGLILIVVFMISYYRFPGFLASLALLMYTIVAFAVFKIGISGTAVILVGLFFFLSLTVNARFGFLALLSYLVLMFFGSLQPVTLTLAGIAGFILSIGMAVDANILIFERLKEEIRAGKDTAKAVEDGFNRAWLSIRDSNVSSLITCFILYMYGTPTIKGFAVTLAVGILVSMFTAISVTKNLLKIFMGNNLLTRPWLFGVTRKTAEQKV